MNGRLAWTETAELDVVEIWLHIAADDVLAATQMVMRIQAKCEQLADHPQSGVRRPELGKRLRSSPVAKLCGVLRAD